MEPRVAALEASMKTVEATLGRIEPKLDKLDDRVRAIEVDLGTIKGQLNLLVAKVPSWWQQPVGVVAIIGALIGAMALGKALGVLH